MKTEVLKRTTNAPTSTSQVHQENMRNNRKTLKVLQASQDKENLAGRSIIKDSKLEGDKIEMKRKKVVHKGIQVSIPTVITKEDLTEEEPTEGYWRLLAEKRGEALNESLQENEKLKEDIVNLKEENKICKEMLEESRNLVEVLQEMIDNPEDTEETNEQ